MQPVTLCLGTTNIHTHAHTLVLNTYKTHRSYTLSESGDALGPDNQRDSVRGLKQSGAYE